MADAILPVVDNDAAERNVDVESLTVGANTVVRERDRIAGSGAAELADVKAAHPTSGLYGLVVRLVSLFEDAAHASGDPGIFAMGVQKATPANLAGTDGDYEGYQVSLGRVWVARAPLTVVSVTPVVTATPDYSIGDAVGGKQTLAAAGRHSGAAIRLSSLTIIDKANVKPQFQVVLFDSDPAAATITDNAAFVISTDISKVIARIPVVTADYVTVNATVAFAVAHPDLTRVRDLKLSGSTSMYAAVVADAAINLAAVDDLIFKYGIEQD